MSKTILIVDDEQDLAAAVAFAMEQQGWRTLVAHNDRTALELAEQQPARPRCISRRCGGRGIASERRLGLRHGPGLGPLPQHPRWLFPVHGAKSRLVLLETSFQLGGKVLPGFQLKRPHDFTPKAEGLGAGLGRVVLRSNVGNVELSLESQVKHRG